MKPISEMTGAELAEACAVEVLGKQDVVNRIAGEWTAQVLLSPEGRDLIESELERRGWEMCLTNCQIDKDWTFRISGADPEPSFKEPCVTHKNKHRAICEAALMAVRGEKK